MSIVNEESLQTSKDEIILDTQTGIVDTTGNSETSGGEGGQETHEGGQATPESSKEDLDAEGKPINYKTKFSESSREALRLLEENKRLGTELEQARGSSTQLETDLKEARDVLKETNPEAYNFKSLEKSVKEIETKLAISKENESLGNYLTSNPSAAAIKESLRVLGRTFPNKSYDELWTEHFAPIAAKAATDAKAKKDQKIANGTENGQGSPSGDLTGDVDDKEFNKLSLAERKVILKKRGY